MKVDPLHYITPPHLFGEALLENIKAVLTAGVTTVQLRLKEKTEEEVLMMSLKVMGLKERHFFTFIVNDYVKVARQVKADGVHLGQNDMCIKEARKILGNKIIIGGTAHSLAEFKEVVDAGADYIGYGPLRNTKTKTDLTALKGFEGYEFVKRYKEKGGTIPVLAVGGVLSTDFDVLAKCGVHGVAVSSLLFKAEKKQVILDDANRCFTTS